MEPVVGADELFCEYMDFMESGGASTFLLHDS